MSSIQKILVANRGEIASRIFSTCHMRHIKTVAIYSEDDKDSPFVSEADEAILIGQGKLVDTYLNMNLIIEKARQHHVDAIHPGYGFLAENETFCRKVEEAGMVFLGPEAEHISLMADKIKARSLASELGVPTLKGVEVEGKDLEEIKKELKELSYPLLVKAASGGGGKGMKKVEDENELEGLLESASREAEKAFSDGRIYVEKFLEQPRHIEVQIFSDPKGQHVHLYTRECSIQRRHQKIIEEAPAPRLKKSVMRKMEDVSLKIARHIGYRGVGTIEFMVDEKDQFYFLEMNTRLQVEHAVTEWVTGLDLVGLQIDLANGLETFSKQSDIQMRGHAIEARLYAENPEENFLPSVGKLQVLKIPHYRNVRVECTYRENNEVTGNYDPLLAKISAYGLDREEARQQLLSALEKITIVGPKTNIGLLKKVLASEAFCQELCHTAFLEEHPEWLMKKPLEDNEKERCLAAYFLLKNQVQAQPVLGASEKGLHVWEAKELRGFRQR